MSLVLFPLNSSHLRFPGLLALSSQLKEIPRFFLFGPLATDFLWAASGGNGRFYFTNFMSLLLVVLC